MLPPSRILFSRGWRATHELHGQPGPGHGGVVILDRELLGKVTDACEVDFIERIVPDSTAQVIPGGFTVKLPACGIASVKVQFEN